jgi:hypothetical protein
MRSSCSSFNELTSDFSYLQKLFRMFAICMMLALFGAFAPSINATDFRFTVTADRMQKCLTQKVKLPVERGGLAFQLRERAG